jgi:hypothetical protein
MRVISSSSAEFRKAAAKASWYAGQHVVCKTCDCHFELEAFDHIEEVSRIFPHVHGLIAGDGQPMGRVIIKVACPGCGREAYAVVFDYSEQPTLVT